MAYPPTAEQQAAIDTYRSGAGLVLEAGAGTGKTSTLRFMAESTPNRRGLYLAFNASVRDEARKTFKGTGIIPHTSHSLAFQVFGTPLAPKLGFTRVPWYTQAKEFRSGASWVLHPTDPGADPIQVPPKQLISMAAGAVAAFCKTTDDTIAPVHVTLPPHPEVDPAELDALRAHVVTIAERQWEDIKDPEGKLPIVHDHYLKMWAMSRPMLNTDLILYDEAQDADRNVLSVIKAQHHSQIVAVGDASQAIYGWRGAVSAMDQFDGPRHQLIQSWRFGQAVADEANVWLGLLQANLRLSGNPTMASTVGISNASPDAALCRSNSGVLDQVITAHKNRTLVAIAGKNKATQLRNLASAAAELQSGKGTSHPELFAFTSWDQVREYATNDDSDISALVKIVDRYGATTVVEAIDGCVSERQAELVVSTAHVAKGREWGHVLIADDFREPAKFKDGTQKGMSREDAMLAYVSVTRARTHLDPAGLAWVHRFTGVVPAPPHHQPAPTAG